MAQLVAALDVDDAGRAFALAEQLQGTVQWLKIGFELAILAGPDLVRKLKHKNFKIFLDLKFYDIPNTVARAVKAAGNIGVDMLTLHCQGGPRMCAAAREAADSLPVSPLLFGVTALTSFSRGEMPGISLDPGDFGRFLASEAARWGLDGVVCSGLEAENIKNDNPELLCLCPGIRLQPVANDDQSRIMTPEMAVRAGADFLVVGRPVLEASDPAQAAAEIVAAMTSVVSGATSRNPE